MAKKNSMFDYAPVIISLVALLSCYFLYRKIQSDDTSDRLFNFILKQNEHNKQFTTGISELQSFVEEDEEPTEKIIKTKENTPEDVKSNDKPIIDISSD
jgi:hypothetical protein